MREGLGVLGESPWRKWVTWDKPMDLPSILCFLIMDALSEAMPNPSCRVLPARQNVEPTTGSPIQPLKLFPVRPMVMTTSKTANGKFQMFLPPGI